MCFTVPKYSALTMGPSERPPFALTEAGTLVKAQSLCVCVFFFFLF